MTLQLDLHKRPSLRSRKLQRRSMAYTMKNLGINSIKNLALLSLFLAAALILLFSTYNSSFSSDEHSISVSAPKDELEEALERASMANKTVIITIINEAYVEPHGDEYPSMFDLFLEGFWVGEGTRPLLGNLLVVAMDKTAHERCLFRRLNCYRVAAEGDGDGGDRFAKEKVYLSEEFIEMMWRRTLFLLDALKRGYNFIFTDTDIMWLRNPFTRLTNNEEIDIQFSTDFYNGSEPHLKKLINTGFYFIRSNNKTISLYQKWYDNRKNSTGLKEQDVLANLIRDGILEELNLKARFLNTLYFSGFCKDSTDIRSVLTFHANCCRSIRAKVVDLKVLLKDWKRSFKERHESSDSRNSTSEFKWSKHKACRNSWNDNALG